MFLRKILGSQAKLLTFAGVYHLPRYPQRRSGINAVQEKVFKICHWEKPLQKCTINLSTCVCAQACTHTHMYTRLQLQNLPLFALGSGIKGVWFLILISFVFINISWFLWELFVCMCALTHVCVYPGCRLSCLGQCPHRCFSWGYREATVKWHRDVLQGQGRWLVRQSGCCANTRLWISIPAPTSEARPWGTCLSS